MDIPSELMGKWEKLKSHGDGAIIVKESEGKIRPIDITRAFQKGRCSDLVFQAIADFYRKKEDTVKAYL